MCANHPQPIVGAACVLLRHDLPDGTWHVDWLLDSRRSAANIGDPESRDLMAFRLPGRVDDLTAGARLPAERIADHRRLYLEFEGDIPGQRGRVNRLNRGQVVHVATAAQPQSLYLEIRWESPFGGLEQRLRLEPDVQTAQPQRWVVHCDSCRCSAQ